MLAGGASRRMGRDKARVQYDNVPLATRVGSALEDGGCHPVSIVGKDSGLEALGYNLILDNHPDHHPLYGVAAALKNAGTGLVLVSPCDLVHLTGEAVQTLLRHGSPCVATGPHRIHPLLAVLSCEWADKAFHLATQGAGAYELVRLLPRVTVPEMQLHDANYPRDLDTQK